MLPNFNLENSTLTHTSSKKLELLDSRMYSNKSENSKEYFNFFKISKIEDNKKKIKSFLNLKPNWNGYGGLPIEKNVVERVLGIFEESPSEVEFYPTGRNSIQLELHKNNGDYIEIEITENSCELYSIIDNKDIEENISIQDIPKRLNFQE